jgi:chromosomal replication initiator protein
VVLLIGPPGIGKSRLIREFAKPGDLVLDPCPDDYSPAALDAVLLEDRRVFATALTSNEFHSFPPKLRTRLVGGAVVQLEPWPLHERQRFFRSICAAAGEDLVAQVAAAMVTPAELVGAAITLSAAIPMGAVETARALNGLVPNSLTIMGRILPDAIIHEVCERFGVREADLKGPSRTRGYAYPRHVAMYLHTLLTGLTLNEIGAHFGNRDHSTVLHAKANIAGRMLTDARVQQDVEAIKLRLGARMGKRELWAREPK